MKTKRVITKRSGVWGQQSRLRTSYASFDEFKSCSEMYGIHTRLGFKTARGAWRSNPVVESSVIPSDLRRLDKGEKTRVD